MVDLTIKDANAAASGGGCGCGGCGCGGDAQATPAQEPQAKAGCNCGPDCDCGCQDGKPCTCDDTDAKAGCNCGPDCDCGCQDGKPCTCGTADTTSAGSAKTAPSGDLGGEAVMQYTVSGMTCGHCVSAITEEVSAIPGVTDVKVDLESGQMKVASDAPVDFDRIVEAVAEAGDYTVE